MEDVVNKYLKDLAGYEVKTEPSNLPWFLVGLAAVVVAQAVAVVVAP